VVQFRAHVFVRMIQMHISIGFYVLLGLCIFGAAAVYRVSRQRLPLKLSRFDGREHFSLKALHDNFYPRYEMETFAELWSEIASAVEVPPGLMRPTDKFEGELGPVKGFEVASEMDDLEEALMRRCEQAQLDYRKVKVETVDDYIRLFLEPAGI